MKSRICELGGKSARSFRRAVARESSDSRYRNVPQEEPKSFLSLDTEGRVIRLDSFSKVISSGIRLGFMTAAAPLIASVELHLQSSHLHAPTLSQVGSPTFFARRGRSPLRTEGVARTLDVRRARTRRCPELLRRISLATIAAADQHAIYLRINGGLRRFVNSLLYRIVSYDALSINSTGVL